MQIVNVWLEHSVMNLNRTFSYCCGDEVRLERGMRVTVPLGSQQVVGFVDSCEHSDLSAEEYQQANGFEIKEISELIDNEPLMNDELYELGLWMARQTVSTNIACFQSMLPAKMKPKGNRQKAVMEYYIELIDPSQATSNKQKAAVEALKNGGMLRSEFNRNYPGVYGVLFERGAIKVTAKEREAEVSNLEIREAGYPLTEEQKQAIEKINNSQKDVILLHGLTGSGKTEVYMQLAAQKCRQGKQVLILVPEISLTPQMVSRMTSRFGNNIAIYHSKLNNQERYEQYQLVRKHKVSIVGGTRSAVFMPFDNLGLIVLDEEHDHSYKQDSTPKYHCRDVAIHRAQHHGCKVILGSATPTLESYARAIKGVYDLVELKNRIYQNLPKSYLIDMQKQLRKGNTILSQPLKDAMRERLENHEQCILLLNRRGYTPIMRCSSCGEVIQCPHCDIAMSYHKDENILMCHTCGQTMDADIACPTCGSRSWLHYGVGTQRLYEAVQKEFPEARILRMDADTTRKKGGHQEILEQFERHEADILLGTQMIAKGLDYPDVTLVGIFNADALLARMDYRCVEVTFDLIVQASGRSGRGKRKGEVFVQAYNCSHYGIQLAVKQDYVNFFKREMNYRHIGTYPPYCYMAAIMFVSGDEGKVQKAAYEGAQHFRSIEGLRVLGPSQLNRSFDEYRHRIVIKSMDREKMIDDVWNWFQQLSYNKQQLRIQIDIDPYVRD